MAFLLGGANATGIGAVLVLHDPLACGHIGDDFRDPRQASPASPSSARAS
ncbi:MAG: hypothetical protein ACRESR_07995 [Gammaproteobacteria bacterium]